MKLKVQYTAQTRSAAGKSAEEIELAGPAAIGDVLRHIAQRYGESMRRVVLDAHGAPHPALLLFVNDDQVRPADAPPLNEGDTLAILAPIAGG